MPLIVVCGLPSSGKSTVSKAIKEFVNCQKSNIPVRIVCDEDYTTFTRDIYHDSTKEKEERGYLRSEVQKVLRQDQLAILDSLNYIKGFRYELFCLAKNAKTTYCVVFCDESKDTVRKYNENKPADQRYSEDVLEALSLRFETPDSRNRWDNPLFTVNSDNCPLEMESLMQSLFEGKLLTPNQSTQSQPLAPTNFLYELDKTCQNIVVTLISEMKTAIPGDEINVPGTSAKFNFTRTWSLADLNRFKRQFINYTKQNPIEDTNKIANMFVTFLNNTV